jgi:TrmH family RNA methyltransferase
MERITSRQNAIVKRFRDLAHGGEAAVSGEILLDGAHLVQEALACGVPIEIAAFSERQLGSSRAPLAQVAAEVRRYAGRVVGVSDQVLAAMSPVEQPSGVVAIGFLKPSTVEAAFLGSDPTSHAAAPPGSDPKKGAARGGSGSDPKRGSGRTAGSDPRRGATAGSDPEAPLVVVLAGLQDPGNVGAIVRTAAACGATGLITIEGSANPFGWKALRGAMGGTFRLPVAARAQMPDVITAAKDAGVRLVAAVPRGGTPLPQLDLRQPTAIVFGGEGAGVAHVTAVSAAELVTVPMRRPVESLNVSVAAALILYEASRQREAED